MNSNETFIRSVELERQRRCLPATSYNLAKVLLARSEQKVVFVPIRSMQYLAVLDEEEFIFVDAQGMRQMVQLAWQSFRPQDRSSLDQPVAYEAVYYSPQAKSLMWRLEGAFFQALSQLRAKQPVASRRGEIVSLER
jgi:hypothetical protein